MVDLSDFLCMYHMRLRDMMLAPNSRTRMERKEKGEVKGEYGGMTIMIAPNSSRARKRR